MTFLLTKYYLNLMDLTKGLFLLFVFFNQAEKCRIVGVPGYVFGSSSATV
jgi:GTP-binding protein EngB required for normal cell division